MAFTPPGSSSEGEQQKRDSSMVNVKFSPAQIVVSDNRTVEGISTIIGNNTESNKEIARAINGAVDAALSVAQGRRCESYMDRITTKTGLTTKQAEKIIHKKKVFDMSFYVVFLLYISYTLITITSWIMFSKAIVYRRYG